MICEHGVRIAQTDQESKWNFKDCRQYLNVIGSMRMHLSRHGGTEYRYTAVCNKETTQMKWKGSLIGKLVKITASKTLKGERRRDHQNISWL
jgi:hypothetical protein